VLIAETAGRSFAAGTVGLILFLDLADAGVAVPQEREMIG